MPNPIDELRQQRALLQQHLNWLDRKIAELDSTPEPNQLSDEPSKTISTEKISQTLPQITSKPEDPDNIEKFISKYTHSQTDIDRLKLGCIGFFVGAALLFLFILFGLPYLIG